MSFDELEASNEDSQPREIYTIAHGSTTYRHTSGVRDVVIDNVIYTADAIARSASEVPAISQNGDKAIAILLRIDHPFVRRWFWKGIPPKLATVTLARANGESVETYWQGLVVAIDTEDETAKVHVASQLGPPVRRRLPTLTAGRQCQNALYDDACKVDPNSFKVATTVLAVDGHNVRVDMGSLDFDFDWADLGKLRHVASGEQMTIIKQTDDNSGVLTTTTLEIHMPIYGMQVGDAVEIFAGCQHSNVACFAKFDNILNFVGMPAMPTRNPFFAWGLGIMEPK